MEILNTFSSGDSTLLVKSVTTEDAGAYVCVAGNSIGVSQSAAYLTVKPSSSMNNGSFQTWLNFEYGSTDTDRLQTKISTCETTSGVIRGTEVSSALSQNRVGAL